MTVVDYDPSWPAAYEAEIERLRAVLGDVIVRAHHIGSTAVPGLAAKPVIDASSSRFGTSLCSTLTTT